MNHEHLCIPIRYWLRRRHCNVRLRRVVTAADLELRSQLYAYLGGATSTASGHEWDHDRLRVFIDSLMELPAMRGLAQTVTRLHALADEMDREDPQVSTYHIARCIRTALAEEAS